MGVDFGSLVMFSFLFSPSDRSGYVLPGAAAQVFFFSLFFWGGGGLGRVEVGSLFICLLMSWGTILFTNLLCLRTDDIFGQFFNFSQRTWQL